MSMEELNFGGDAFPERGNLNEKTTITESTSLDPNDTSIEAQFKLVLQHWYKAMIYGIALFVIYFLVSTYTNLLNYDVIVNSSVIDSLVNTSSTLIKGTRKEQEINRSIARLGNHYVKSMAETFKPKNNVLGVYCIDKEDYIQNAINFNNNTESLYNNAFQNAGGLANNNGQYNQTALSNMTSAIALMVYEACGKVEGNIYLAKMNTIRRKTVDADIVNISVGNVNADNDNFIVSLMAYRDKKIQSGFINNIKDENSNLFALKEKYLTLSVWTTTHTNVVKNNKGETVKTEDSTKEIKKQRDIVVSNEDFFFKYPISLQKIGWQQMKTDKLAVNEYVTWIKIFWFNLLPEFWLLGILGSIKYSLNAFLYIWPITSLLFGKYVFLTMALLYIGFCIILLEVLPQLIFFIKRLKLTWLLIWGIDITTKIVYNVGMVLIFISLMNNLIIPLLWIFG